MISLTPSFGPLFYFSTSRTSHPSRSHLNLSSSNINNFLRRRRRHASHHSSTAIESSRCRRSSVCHSSRAPLWKSASQRIVPHRCITRSSPRPAAEKRPSILTFGIGPKLLEGLENYWFQPLSICNLTTSFSLPTATVFRLGKSLSQHYTDCSHWRIVWFPWLKSARRYSELGIFQQGLCSRVRRRRINFW